MILLLLSLSKTRFFISLCLPLYSSLGSTMKPLPSYTHSLSLTSISLSTPPAPCPTMAYLSLPLLGSLSLSCTSSLLKWFLKPYIRVLALYAIACTKIHSIRVRTHSAFVSSSRIPIFAVSATFHGSARHNQCPGKVEATCGFRAGVCNSTQSTCCPWNGHPTKASNARLQGVGSLDIWCSVS